MYNKTIPAKNFKTAHQYNFERNKLIRNANILKYILRKRGEISECKLQILEYFVF